MISLENNEIVTWLGILVTGYGLFPYGMESSATIGIVIVGLVMIFAGYYWDKIGTFTQ